MSGATTTPGTPNAPDSVTFDAAVWKIQTLADGGIRVALDLPETAIDAATWLMQAKRNGMALHVACLPCKTGALVQNRKNKNGVAEGENKQSEWAA